MFYSDNKKSKMCVILEMEKGRLGRECVFLGQGMYSMRLLDRKRFTEFGNVCVCSLKMST